MADAYQGWTMEQKAAFHHETVEQFAQRMARREKGETN
jgi:hypothetical protein